MRRTKIGILGVASVVLFVDNGSGLNWFFFELDNGVYHFRLGVLDI
jgi:hypothetical protein